MRALLVCSALALASTTLRGQAALPPPAQTPDSARLKAQVAQLRETGDSTRIPTADHFSFGDHTVPAGTTVSGPVALAKGNLDVYGTIDGDVFIIDGDVRVHKGARIAGDALAAGGKVIVEGGVVEGEMRSLTGFREGGARVAQPRPPLTTWASIKITIGWFAVLLIIGLGVMVFAEGNLDGVVIGLERGFAKAFWTGVLGQVVVLPVLVVVVVALALTVLGVLLIPFAIVAYVIAVAGLVTLGFLAVARLTGTALVSDAGTTSPRGVHLRALFFGLAVYFGLWLAAAAFTWSPLGASILRGIALAVTWVAATLGLGATLASRAGTQRPGAMTDRPRTTSEEMSWQTPTPVSGVAAARRPVSSSARGS